MFNLLSFIRAIFAGRADLAAGPFALLALPGSGDGFQSFVNKELPPGIPGDWAGANIRANFPAGPFQLVASPGGVTVGAMAWANPATGLATTYFVPNAASGFVHREGQGIITSFLGIATMEIPGGDGVTPQVQGDWWGLLAGGGTAGQKIYADPVTGALSAGATGGSVKLTGGLGTIAASVLTVTTAPSPANLAVGQIIEMAGVPHGTYIASLGTGTGGLGTYNLANVDGTAIPNVGSATAFTAYGTQETQFFLAQNVTADANFTATLAAPAAGTAFGVLTVSAVGSGALAPGQFISSAGAVAVPGSANIQILQQLTGTSGGTGTYLTSNTSYVVGSGQAFTGTQGKMGKISSWANFW